MYWIVSRDKSKCKCTLSHVTGRDVLYCVMWQEEGGAMPVDANADAYVVVYSVEDRLSLDTAADMLYELRRRLGRHTPVILVANKTDLVRTRVISEPG